MTTRTTTTTRTKAVSDNAPSSNADDALTRERDGGDESGTGEGAGTKSTPSAGGTEAVARSGGTNGRVRATTDSAGAVRGTWEDVDGGDGGDGSSGGGSGGDGGDDGDGDSASGNGVSTWLRTKTREMHGATEGGALFGALVVVVMNGVAWVFFSALKPSPAEREKYALETRRAETAAKERAKAERAARKEMGKAEKRRWMTAKPPSVAEPPKTAPVAEAVVEETAEAIEGDRNGEAEASSAERARAPAVEDKASTSGDSSEDDSAVKIVAVQHRPSGKSASEDEAVEPETSSDSVEAESAFEERMRECEEEQHRAEDAFLEKCHHDDEEYLPAHEEHPNYKIIRAVREANALMHDVHARRAEVNHEFAEALRYRKQVIHMAAEHGIPVAPLREIKETFDQEESPPLGVTAREKANQAARSAFSATKKFVHFATPHVQAASSKALEFTKDTAGKATTAASERLKDVKAKQASGELRAPTMDEAVAAAKSTSRRALGAVIHAYDRIAGHVRELKP